MKTPQQRMVYLLLFCLMNLYSYGQVKRTIAGNVKGTDGELLIGAIIRVKGSTEATVTDVNGHYEIKVKDANSILEYSYLGNKRVEKVGERTVINITLSNVNTLQTTVVTGFQTLSKDRTSGAFETMNKEILEKLPASDVTSLLRGQMAGVDVNKSGEISIRGISYLSSVSRPPLIVVDGFPIEGGIENINPNNIESVTVLKDAAAASIWGARSANGVIVVTTKSAKWDSNDELKISFNSYVRVSDRIDLDYANPIADAKTQLALERYFANELFKYNPGGLYTPTTLITNNVSVQKTMGAYLYAMEKISPLGIPSNIGFISQEDLQRRVGELEKINYQDDVKKYLMRNPIYQQHNFAARGFTKRNNYNFSMLYDKSLSDFIGTDNDRIITEFKNSFRYNTSITFNVGAYMSVSNYHNNGSNMSEVRSLAAYDRLINPDGTYNNHTSDINIGMRNYMNTMPFPYSWNKNLLQDVNSRDFQSNYLTMRFQGGVDIKLLKELKFSTKYQFEKLRSQTLDYMSTENSETRRIINTFSVVNPAQDSIRSSFFPKGGIRKNNTSDNTSAYNVRSQLDFNKVFNDVHEVALMGGVEFINNLKTGQVFPWQFGVNPNVNGTAILASTNTTTTDFTGNLSSLPHRINTASTYSNRRYFSMFFNGSYTFNRKYTLTGSVRTDASNIISSDPKYRYVPLWSAGFNWNIGDEKFIRNLGLFDRLNLRSSYGYNAQAAIGSSNITTITNTIGDRFNDYNLDGGIASFGNSSLRWEKTAVVNVGIDYSIKNALLYGKFDVYNKQGVDLLYNRALPGTLGFGETMMMNYASVLNRGFEVELGTNIAISNGIRLTSEINYAYNFNQITKLDITDRQVYESRGEGAFVKGGTIGDYYAFDYAGFYNNIPYVRKLDGTLFPMNATLPNMSNTSAGLLRKLGTTIAPHTLGFSNTLKIKDFSITALISGKFGHVFSKYPVFSSAALNMQYNYNKNMPDNVDNRWSPDYPALINATTLNQLRERSNYIPYLSSNVDDASYIRLNNVIFDYNFTKLGSKKGFMNNFKGLTIYGQVQNLGNIWVANKWGMNPEAVEGTVKPQTSYTIGFKLNI